MARPRIFISSTYYDLKNVRDDLQIFITNQGYEPVLYERGHIAFGKDEKFDSSCYREIPSCDIVVAIIGGRRGSKSSKEPDYSISNMELKTAIQNGKQVYIFIEKAVYFEYQTYSKNINNKDINYHAVEDKAVYAFIHELYLLPSNNLIQPFESSGDIITYLKEQWAGLFQRLLSNANRQTEIDLIGDLKTTAGTLKHLVNYLKQQNEDDRPFINDILLINHPAFKQLQNTLNISHPIIFKSFDELKLLLEARGFNRDSNDEFGNSVWKTAEDEKEFILKINIGIFGKNSNLKIYTLSDWNNKWITLEEREQEEVFETTNAIADFDDDIPF